MLKDNIEKIFRDYLASLNENFADHPLAAVLRHDFPTYLESLTDSSEKYKFSGSAGQGNWTYSPWVGVFNKKITESAQKGYYIVYLFREDMKGVFLSLNQGMTDIRNQTSNNARTKEILKSRASNYLSKLPIQTSKEFVKEIDLGVVNSPNAPYYEAGNILAKYYSSDNLPSEDILESDFKEFLNLYDILADENTLTTIGEVKEIQKAQNRFINILKNCSTKTVNGKAGFQGGQETGEVYWIDNLGIWLMTRKIDDSRYWNGFGIEEPFEGKGLTITCEINFPIEGIKRNVAAAFVKDEQGNIYVIHRGNLGGKYSKKDFIEKYTGKWTQIQDGDRKTNVVIIGGLNDPKLPEKVKTFIFDIVQIKTHGNLREYIGKILKYYHNARKEKFKGHSMAKHIKEEFPKYLNLITPNHSKYVIRGNVGQSGVGLNWTCCPSIKIVDTAIGTNFNSGPFMMYIFSDDAKSVYLSLNQPIQKPSDYSSEEWMQKLKNQSAELRKKLENPERFKLKTLSLESHETYYKRYEIANIWAIRYDLDNLPSEEDLITDYLGILNLYQELIIGPPPKPEFNSFYEFYTHKGFYFEPEIVENLLLSLKIKPFIILTGNSGTGKTKIAQLFADYLKKTTNSQYKLVPVGANWTENRHLLGFYNIITKNYQKTAALSLIMNARQNLETIYFLVLDEMNLSHVERYFADFLSAMESDEPIPLHSNEDFEIPWELDIPRNLLVIGTVNVDETTYMFSPKVLDRANTIEFSAYPAKDYMNNNHYNEPPEGNLEYLENPLSDLETRKFTVEDLKENLKDVKINSNDNLWNVLADEIQAFQEVLGKAGFDFGFRVINEILRFMYVAWVYEGEPKVWSNWMRYFDAQIKQKMLPKLHGSQRVLEEVLKDLFDLCYIDTIDSPPRSFEDLKSVPTVKYLESAQKIQEMDKVLNEQRYVSFIN